MLKPTAMFLWRKLDHPGFDSCRLFKLANGWRLEGVAICWENGRHCRLHYDVVADRAWRARTAKVSGFIGKRPVDLQIRTRTGRWEINEVSKPDLEGCADVDLGFTPATNMLVLRRLALKVGERAEAPAAYLQFPQMRLLLLPQTYQRIGRRLYAYEAPMFGYSGRLQVTSTGAVIRYPGLFERLVPGCPSRQKRSRGPFVTPSFD